MTLLYFLLLYAIYLVLVWWLDRKVPTPWYPRLRQLHWITVGLCGLGVAAPALTLGDWTFRSPALYCGLLLASGLLAGIRGRLRLARLPALATVQAVLVGLATPLLVYSADSLSSDTAYADSSYTVTVTEHISWMDDNLRYPEVQLYGTRLVLFEQYLGHAALSASNFQYSTPQMKDWWHGTSSQVPEVTPEGLVQAMTDAIPQGVRLTPEPGQFMALPQGGRCRAAVARRAPARPGGERGRARARRGPQSRRGLPAGGRHGIGRPSAAHGPGVPGDEWRPAAGVLRPAPEQGRSW
jgi:hypothetical protein